MRVYGFGRSIVECPSRKTCERALSKALATYLCEVRNMCHIWKI